MLIMSSQYAISSHLEWHGLDPHVNLLLVAVGRNDLLSTNAICDTIITFVEDTALLILSGVQFHTGQLLDIPTITAFAQEWGIVVGWDLAHAVGNVELKLHD